MAYNKKLNTQYGAKYQGLSKCDMNDLSHNFLRFKCIIEIVARKHNFD